MELVCIQKDLTEGRIRKLKSTAFFDPCSCRFGSSDVDLMLTGSCDSVSKTSHDIFFGKNINQTTVIFFWHKVAAIGINTFLQNIGYLTEVGTERLKHTILVFIRSTTSFCRFIGGRIPRLRSERLVYRLIKLGFQCFLSFKTSNFLTKICDFLFHSGISSIVLGSKCTFLGTMRIEKCLCSIPRCIALFTQF